jgi:superfamily II DNA or RNA helicase
MRYSQQEIDMLLRTYPDPSVRKGIIQGYVYTQWLSTMAKRGTFVGATGVGKSRIGVMAAEMQFQKNPNSVIYAIAPTESLRDVEWPDEFRKWGCEHLISKIKFICYASIADEVVQGEIDLVLLDECHHITPLNSVFFENNRVWNIFAFTATYPNINDDIDKFALLNHLCPVFFQIPIEDAVALKLVTEFEIKVLLFDLDDKDKYIESGPKKHRIMTTELGHYKYLTKQIQQCIIQKREGAKFKWIGDRMRFLYNIRTREWIAKDVMDALMKEDKRTLIFTGSIDLCEKLCKPNTFHSETNDTALTEFAAKIRPYLGAVNALNEGKNLPEVDQTIVVQLDSNARNIVQRIGRGIRWRPNHIGLVVILVARGTADEKWYKQAVAEIDPKRIKEYIVHAKARV